MLTYAVLCLTLALADAYIPKFQRSKAYTPITTADEKNPSKTFNETLGFSSAILPYHGNVNDELYNPVIELTGLDDTYIEVKAETEVDGARICFADTAGSNGGSVCASGKLKGCYTPSASALKIEFFCDASCDSNDVNFKYRIVKSDVNADDLWCTNRGESGWPSDLQLGVLPDRKKKPTKKGPVNNANLLSLSSLILLLTTLISAYIFM